MKKITTILASFMFFVAINVFSQNVGINTNCSSFSKIPTNDLLAYYPFNSNANDESGNGYNGNIDGAILTTDRFGNVNSAFSFDGDNDRIVLPFNSKIFTSNTFSLNFWYYKIKNTLGADSQGLIGSDNSVNRGINLNISNDFIRNHMYTGSIQQYYFDYYGAITNATWYFVTVQYNGSSFQMFVNGSLVHEIPASGNLYHNGINFEVGHDTYNTQSCRWFGGKIDDIRVYNRALTDLEIQSLYREK